MIWKGIALPIYSPTADGAWQHKKNWTETSKTGWIQNIDLGKVTGKILQL